MTQPANNVEQKKKVTFKSYDFLVTLLVRFDRIQRHFIELRLTKFPSGSLTLLTKPNAVGECAVYLRVLMQDSIDYVR